MPTSELGNGEQAVSKPRSGGHLATAGHSAAVPSVPRPATQTDSHLLSEPSQPVRQLNEGPKQEAGEEDRDGGQVTPLMGKTGCQGCSEFQILITMKKKKSTWNVMMFFKQATTTK